MARDARVPLRGAGRAIGFPGRRERRYFQTPRRRLRPGSRLKRTRYSRRRTRRSMHAAAPLVMAALQVHWVALAAHFVADKVKALDVPGLCPLCGTLPVASVVCAQSPYQGYRYLHCALCATEWHMVRVQCTSVRRLRQEHRLPFPRKQYRRARPRRPRRTGAVRAETCEQCRGYRKILYQENDTGVEPVADDVASLALDLLLGERGLSSRQRQPAAMACRTRPQHRDRRLDTGKCLRTSLRWIGC